jgi:hypothetical protein
MTSLIVFWLFALGIGALLLGLHTIGIVLFVVMLVISLADDPPAWLR